MAQWKRRSSSNSTMAMAVAAVVLTALTMGANAAVHGHMDLCKSYTRVCNDFTSQMDCWSHFDRQTSKPMLDVQSCTGASYDTFVGRCQCGALDGSAVVLQEIVSYSVVPALPSIMEPSPTEPNAIDYGATYVKACSVFLSGANCPSNLQIVAGHGAGPTGGFQDFKGDCACGTIDVSDQVRDALNSYLINKKLGATTVTLNTTSTGPGPAAAMGSTAIDVCATFTGVCGTFLDGVACPVALRNKTGCSTPGAAQTLGGACKCGALDASDSVMTALLHVTLPEAALESAKVLKQETAAKMAVAGGEAPIEFCETYANTCSEFLTAAGIEKGLHEAQSNCVGGNGTNLATFSGYCGAGTLNVSRPLTSLLVGHAVDEVDDLLCLGDSCNPKHMNHGVMAIIGVSAALAVSVLALFANQRWNAKRHAKQPASHEEV